ncbi:MAG: PorT family protein [Bacteroidetes bacterium]|nr:PorT family protein [Bacteroidota bacterium]MBL7103360.1 PorT family protein [Bacteroidales bacterium]
MRKKIIISIILLIYGIQGFAQIKPFRFGFKVAPNIAWISPDSKTYKSDGSVIGFSWGFLADFTLTENYFVKTGFNMDYHSGKLEYPHTIPPDTGTMHRKYNLRYLQIPLTLKMRTNKFGKFAYFGEIGFGTSFNLRAKSKDEFIYNNGQNTYDTEDIKDEIVFMKESIILGIGIEYFVDESTSIIAELTFNHGISNVLKGENTADPNIKQKGFLYYFELNIGVMF